jgi:ribonuclease HI
LNFQPYLDITTPIWTLPKLNISCTDFSKQDLQVANLQLARDIINTRYRDSLQIYTDGSYNPDSGSTSCAVWIPGINYEKITRLPDHSGIYFAELYAIFLSLIPRILAEFKEIVVLLDSKSALSSLETRPSSRDPLHIKIKIKVLSLNESGVAVYFQWIPGHCRLEGNEKVDTLAKSGHHQTIAKIPVPLSAVRHRLRQALINSWQSQWDNSDKGRHCYFIKSKISSVFSPQTSVRRIDRTFYRSMSGHGNLARLRFLMGKAEHPYCKHCLTEETIEHVFISYSGFRVVFLVFT